MGEITPENIMKLEIGLVTLLRQYDHLSLTTALRSKRSFHGGAFRFYDYRTNVELYAKWQTFLKKHQPKTIIFWGQGDIFFTPAGGEAYLKDLPEAEMHRLQSGHFAVEDHLTLISAKMKEFYDKKVRGGGSRVRPCSER